MKRKWLITIGILIFIVGLTMGLLIAGGDSHEGHGEAEGTSGEAEMWTCSMHPQIQQPGPGKCPLCGMDLIPVKIDTDGKLNPRAIKISENARILAEIQTETVKRDFVPIEVRMTGKIKYDETRLAYITARVPGRLDRLYVNYTGIPVKKNEHMIYFYSPALLTAQEELLQSLRIARSSVAGTLKKEAERTLEAARNKLRLWDITDEQIKEIENRGTSHEYMTINAPLGGIVIGKHVEEGSYVKTGTKIYTIADLSHLWVFLDAYESNLQWLKYGQEVEFTSEAYPGRKFNGQISFIDPVLDGKTRTVRVRVTVDNSQGLLKPEMFVRALVKATVTAEGAIVERNLAGKWISPMHPEVVKDEPGACDVCGMPLVSAETLGYVDPKDKHTAPLLIPASAPLITGKRAVVYIQVNKDRDLFEGRVVELGPRAGDFYVVKSGLSEGDIVVTNGNFKIDSALQIQAKPSMMSPEGGALAPGHDHGGMQKKMPGMEEHKMKKVEVPQAFLKELNPLFKSYFEIQNALAGDNFKKGNKAAGDFHSALMKVNATILKDDSLKEWKKTAKHLNKIAGGLHGSQDINTLRENFSLLSEAMINITRSMAYGGQTEMTRFTCPMAFDNRGGTWLQDNNELKNPYFGAMMLKCGEKNEVFAPAPEPIKEHMDTNIKQKLNIPTSEKEGLSGEIKKGTQTKCPVMGGAISKRSFMDYRGKRIYFCCPGCDGMFKKDPEKYMKQMAEAGVELEIIPSAEKGHAGHGH